MQGNKETPEQKRESLRQEELKRNPTGSMNDAFNKANIGGLADLTGSLGWKGIGILILILIINAYLILRLNPPLEIGTIAITEDKKSVVVGIGNNGFREVQILDVSVNNNVKPLETKLQVSNSIQGFILTDDYKSEESEKYGFTNIDKAAIKAETLSDDETDSKDDEIYGVSVIHNKEINNIHIEYSYFGMTFNDTVYFNNY